MCPVLSEVIVKLLWLSIEGILINKTTDVNHKKPQQFTIKLERLEQMKEQKKYSCCDGMCGAEYKQESDNSIWEEVDKEDFKPGTFVLGPTLKF